MNHPPSIPRPGTRAGAWFAAVALLCGAFPGLAADTPQFPPLTTLSGSPRLPGKFVWADLVTDDVPAARKFYTQLFGWTFQELGGYLIASNDERPLCGIFHRARPADRPNAHPRWFGYISVGNVGKAGQKVTEAGGRVLTPPQKFSGRGEQAIFVDPEGAVFGVIKSSAGDPKDFLPEPGDWIWIQLLSRDAKKASDFYSAVAGYEAVENTATNHASDYVLTSDGYARATVRTIPAGNTKIQPDWLVFVRVKNVAESASKAGQLGGKVLLAPRPELFGGKVAVIADPTGAAIGIMEWPDAMAKGGQ